MEWEQDGVTGEPEKTDWKKLYVMMVAAADDALLALDVGNTAKARKRLMEGLLHCEEIYICQQEKAPIQGQSNPPGKSCAEFH